MKNTVHFGFIAIILIMTLLAFVWLGQVKQSNETVLAMIDDMDSKIEYAHIMHDSIQARQAALLTMLIIADPFELDEKITIFYESASDYRIARKALYDMPANNEEKSFHRLLDEKVVKGIGINNRVVEMFRLEQSKDEITKVLLVAKKYQDELLEVLDQFVHLQRSKDEMVVDYSHKIFKNTQFWILIFGSFAIIIAALISRYVGRCVAEKNTQLQQAGEEMAHAYVKAEEATNIKSAFLATMSHEMRTPLTAIIGFAETTLFSEQSMAQRKNSIQVIIRSGKHLLNIINDILDLSKIEANKLVIENIEIPFFDFLNDIERLIRPSAEEKGLRFSIDYVFPLPKTITSDLLRIKQVLINLCSNAIKFTEQGHVFIKVSCRCDDVSNHLSFAVSDSGIGMTDEQMNQVFEAYHQADSSITRKYGGTGLGLSLSNILAEKLGGSITVASEVNKGSTFVFTLRTERSAETEIVLDKAGLPIFNQEALTISSAKNMSGHILLAEDNEDNQQLFLIYLKRMGAKVTIVENGELAVNAVKENDFDLVLMDMRMPVMGGLEATKLIRKNNQTIPIVALTANAMQEDKEACYKAGCDGFLTKPVDVAKLAETVEKHLEIRAPEVANKVSIMSTLLEDEPEMTVLINRFVDRLEGTLKEIETLIQVYDWKKLADILHKLKGTGGNFGYPILTSLAGEMEFQAINENENELMALFIKLKESHQQILEGIESSKV